MAPPPEVASNSINALGAGTVFDPSRDTSMAPLEPIRYLKPSDAAASRYITSDTPFESGSLKSSQYGGDHHAVGSISHVFSQ
jgi:hypothetical protein